MEQQYSLLKKWAVLLLILVGAISVLLFFRVRSLTKAAKQVAEDEVTFDLEQSNTVMGENNKKQHELQFEETDNTTDYLCIPLQEGTPLDSLTVENHYMDRQLWVYLYGDNTGFYDTAKLSGNRNGVIGGYYETTEEAVILKIDLDGMYEFSNVCENNMLYLNFTSPREKYDKLVVIDPAGPRDIFDTENVGLGEAEITLKIAQCLRDKLNQTDIKVYYTRMDLNPVSETARYELANAIKADMYIRLEVNSDTNSKVFGTESVYNADYFIPGFGSNHLADIMERNVVTQIEGKALGLRAADERDEALKNVTIPATTIQVGYLSNIQEKTLLNRDDYHERVAEGIYQGILASYEILDGNDE